MANQYPTVVSGTTPEIRVDTLDTTPVALVNTGTGLLRYVHVDNRANSQATWLNIYDSNSATYASDDPAIVLKIAAGVQGEIVISDDEGADRSFINGFSATAADAAGQSGSNPAATFNVIFGIDS